MHQTPRTYPCGYVRVVQHGGKGRECVGHQKHAHKGMFVAFDTRGRGAGKGGAVSDTKNTPTGWFLVVEGEGKGKEHPRHKEHNPGVAFFVSGW